MPADPASILATAERILDDLRVIANHGREPDPMQRDAAALATAWRELLTAEITGAYLVTRTPRSRVLKVDELGASRPHRSIRHILVHARDARRIAADLLRAAAEAEAGTGK